MEFKYPRVQTVALSNRLFRNCQEARECTEEETTFDLSATEFITPFGIVLLAGTIGECQRSGKKCKYLRPRKETTKKFLSGIGFNTFFKIKDESHKIESPHVQLKRIYSMDYLLTDQIIDVFNSAIRMTEGVRGSLKLAINELMMNAFDHSGSMIGCYVCAQRYSQARKIRLCITDFGVGLYNKLSAKYPVSDTHAAIRLAIKEGITTREGQTGGYGLSHINRFIEINEGKMCIMSGDGKVLWDYKTTSRAKVKNQTMHFPFGGTIINLEINVDGEGFYFLESQDGGIF